MKNHFLFLLSALLFYLWNSLLSKPLLYGQDAEYVRQAAQSAIFIYEPNTQPCAPAQPGQTLLPLGSGFVVGITRRGSTKNAWQGWKFLITAEHVVQTRPSIILRLNRTDVHEFTCFPITLARIGQGQNLYTPDQPGVDLLAINIPHIPHTDPTVFDYSLLLDAEKMAQLEVHEGTDVFAVGYLYGYSGEEQNFPVTKFGKIALLSQEYWYRSTRTMPMRLTEDQKEQIKNATGIPFTDIPVAPGIREQGYLVEMQNTPGLSGAPVMLLSPQFRVTGEGQFQFRRVPPYVVGVIKGLLLAPVGSQAVGSSGVAVIEPASHLRVLIKKLADALSAAGFEIQLSEPTATVSKP